MRLLAAFFLAVLALPGAAAPTQEAAEVEAWIAELVRRGESADPDLVRALADTRDVRALDGLIEAYEEMQSLYMRRAVLRGLARYDEVPALAPRALERITRAAIESSEPEMRAIAIDELARCERHGRPWLRAVVESPAADHARERAMLNLAGDPRADEQAWFRSVWVGPDEEEGVWGLESLRELAFEVLLPDLGEEELREAAEDENRQIALRALTELVRRGDRGAQKQVERTYGDRRLEAGERLAAARLLVRIEGARVGKRLLDDAGRKDAPDELALGLADLVSEMEDPGVHKAVLKELRRAKGRDLLIALRAARRLDDPKVDEALAEALIGDHARARDEALEQVAVRRSAESLPALEELSRREGDIGARLAALEARRAIAPKDAGLRDDVAALADHEDVRLRNFALAFLAESGDARHLPALVLALEHESWSTRLAAARGLEELRAPEGVGALCARIDEEDGRVALELAEILFRLTARPFGTNARAWRAWWEAEGEGFEFPSSAELRQAEREREVRRLKRVSRSDRQELGEAEARAEVGEFFGIRVESRSVAFVLDVSGSMADPTRGSAPGETGPPRIEVARAELLRILDQLDAGAAFNLVLFSGGASAWRPAVVEAGEANLAEARTFLERLGVGGGTNLFGALELAFEDPEVDTIYLLSDGEPSVGAIVDPARIRSVVAGWNAHREVVVHSIAVGGTLRVLEWLAHDSGGTYVRFP